MWVESPTLSSKPGADYWNLGLLMFIFFKIHFGNSKAMNINGTPLIYAYMAGVSKPNITL